MDAKKRKRDEYESDTVAYLRRGAITVLDALDEQLPDVFAAEILPKLSLEDTLNLAQVSKAYRDSVWSVRGVQSLEAKIAAHFEEGNYRIRNQGLLYYATKYGNLPAVRALLQSGVDVNKPVCQCKYVTALWRASQWGHAAVVKELIGAGADVNVRVSVKIATSNEVISDVTPLLIKAGADVNVQGSDGDTPLHMAADFGSEACALALIQAGADVNPKSLHGSPLSLAITNKHEKIVKLLKHFGAR